jgi:hypothetical protein
MFSHRSHFQSNFSSVIGIVGLPLVHKGITARCCIPRSRMSQRSQQGSNGELSSQFNSPHIQHFFSQLLLQFNCNPVSRTDHPPSINKGNKVLPPPSPPARFIEMALLVSFPFVFIFPPPFQIFSHYYFSYNVIQMAALAALPQSIPPYLNFKMSHPPS